VAVGQNVVERSGRNPLTDMPHETPTQKSKKKFGWSPRLIHVLLMNTTKRTNSEKSFPKRKGNGILFFAGKVMASLCVTTTEIIA
jgi:hypothetical protein